MNAVLGVDVGKTGCRAALRVAGGPALVREVSGAPGLAAREGVAATVDAVLGACRAALHDAGVTEIRAVGVGAAGAVAAPDAARALAVRLLAELPAAEVAVGSDAVTSHAGALDGAAGVVLAVGTGAVAVGIGDDGTFALVDGWGPGLGDEGGGAWIGLAGLRAALQAHDGRGPATDLLPAAVDAFGDLVSLPAVLDAGGSPARVAASFAPAVARLAAGGDTAAVVIMNGAAAALARSVWAAARRIGGAEEVALTGGLLKLGPPLLGPLTAALAGLRLVEPAGGSLDGAHLLALRRDTPHETMLARVR